MKCYVCHKEFGDKEKVVPVFEYVVNERRGDFATTMTKDYFHAYHLRMIFQTMGRVM